MCDENISVIPVTVAEKMKVYYKVEVDKVVQGCPIPHTCDAYMSGTPHQFELTFLVYS
jgi:hypothetical protein